MGNAVAGPHRPTHTPSSSSFLVWSEAGGDHGHASGNSAVDEDGGACGDGDSNSSNNHTNTPSRTTEPSPDSTRDSGSPSWLRWNSPSTTSDPESSDRCFFSPFSRRPSAMVVLDLDHQQRDDTDEDMPAAMDDEEASSSSSSTSTEGLISPASGLYSLTSACYSKHVRSFSASSALSSSSHQSTRNSSPPATSMRRSASGLWDSASSSSSLLEYTDEELALPLTPTIASDLSRPGRSIWIVTTAALPWMTGTAINPLLRAKYLSRHGGHTVTLVVPWLESSTDRIALYGPDWETKTASDHEAYLRSNTSWLGDAPNVALLFYPARYHPQLSSIFALGDLCDLLPNDLSDDGVCILEEPEHVNFYRAPGVAGWRQKFSHVIGIVHTNYKAYAQHHYSGLVTGPIVGALSAWMVRAYCDKVIKLSGVLQDYAIEKECVENVHGIRSEFLQPLPAPPPALRSPTPHHKAYFLGKLLWAKGLDKLLELQEYHRRSTGSYFEIDVFGSGPEEDEIRRAYGQHCTSIPSSQKSHGPPNPYYPPWRRKPMPVKFLGRVDHAHVSGEYTVFVNPSITEVLCTSTAEAVARGRFVLVPCHPSNAFFAAFPNCLQYTTKSEFVALLRYAQTHAPTPLTSEQRRSLTWEAATERLVVAASVSQRDDARRNRVGKRWDETLAQWHYDWGRGATGDVLRTVLGGGPVAFQRQYAHSSSSSSLTSVASLSGEGSGRDGAARSLKA